MCIRDRIALVFGMTFSVQALIGKGVFVLWQDLFGGTFETDVYKRQGEGGASVCGIWRMVSGKPYLVL